MRMQVNARLLKPSLTCAAALALFAISGCGKKQSSARLTPLPEDAVVLVYAAGIGEEADFFRSATIDEVLSSALKRKVVCQGQSGEFADNALKRLPSVLEQQRPGLMVLSYGAMDLWKMTDRAKLKASLCGMIDAARSREAQVVMLSLPDLNKLRLTPDPIFEEVALEKGVPLENEVVCAVLKKPDERIFRYMVNDAGIERIALAVKALCVKSGGLAP